MKALKKLLTTAHKTLPNPAPVQVVCNYRDNYYGDQVCKREVALITR